MFTFVLMKNKLTITLIQSSIFWEDVEKNLTHFEHLIANIANTDLILLPEMFNTAFCPHSIHLAETMDGRTIRWMKGVAVKKSCAISGTLMVKEHEKIFNRLVWISENGELFYYDKRHLFSLTKESKYISSGKQRLMVELMGWKICPMICYDLRFPVFCRNDAHYDMLIFLANWPIKRIEAWDTLLKARSIENQCFTIGVNRIGEDGNGILFNGHSKVFDAFGKELYSANEQKEAILQIELSSEDLKLKRKQMNFLQDQDKFTLL